MKTNINGGVTAASLRKAADIADKIQALQAQQTALLTGKPLVGSAKAGKGTRTMTPAQRKKISDGMKARHAARKAGTPSATPAPTPAPTPAA